MVVRGGRRLRDRRQPCSPDGWLGALGGRARARDLPQAGDDSACDEGGARRAPADRRCARGDRGHARARGSGAAMRAPPETFSEYIWAPSTAEIARSVELDPIQVVRFDGNVPAQPAPFARPGAIAGALAEVNTYAHGGFPELVDGIARYAGVAPENVVLGAGADDQILLCGRTFAGPGDTVAID